MLAQGGLAEVDALLGLAPIIPWYERVTGLGHGTPSAMDAAAALAVARDATPAEVSHIPPGADPSGLRDGATVTVTPDDNAKVPVTGVLVAADAREIILRRDDPQTGAIHLHFPRAGFEMRAAQPA